MQKYAHNMQKTCRNMHLICTLYAIKYARNMQEYARICIGAYFAYFAYICTPHFADVCVLPFAHLLKDLQGNLTSLCARSARTTYLCASSRPRRSLRDRRLPASRSCVPHGAPSHGHGDFATFTPPAWSSRLSVPSPLISLLSSLSTERGMRPVRRLRRPGVSPPTPTQTHWAVGPPMPLCGSRFAASASCHPSFPPDFRVVFVCAPPSPCF
jgi:hypothetical protein